MNLRLYREPHTEVAAPDVVRLLFEADDRPCRGRSRSSDFYLYAWIRGGASLDALQAVLDDTWVLSWRAPDTCAFGIIGAEPINRAIRETRAAARRRVILRLLGAARNDEFGQLLALAARRARGDNEGSLELTESEQRVLRGLLKNQRRRR